MPARGNLWRAGCVTGGSRGGADCSNCAPLYMRIGFGEIDGCLPATASVKHVPARDITLVGGCGDATGGLALRCGYVNGQISTDSNDIGGTRRAGLQLWVQCGPGEFRQLAVARHLSTARPLMVTGVGEQPAGPAPQPTAAWLGAAVETARPPHCTQSDLSAAVVFASRLTLPSLSPGQQGDVRGRSLLQSGSDARLAGSPLPGGGVPANGCVACRDAVSSPRHQRHNDRPPPGETIPLLGCRRSQCTLLHPACLYGPSKQVR